MTSELRTFLHNQKAMTLPEVIVSLAIVSLTLLSVWQGFSLAMLSNERASQDNEVVQLANGLLAGQHVERMMLTGDEQVWVGTEKGYHYDLRTELIDQYGQGDQRIQKLYQITLTIDDNQGHQWPFFLVMQVVADE